MDLEQLARLDDAEKDRYVKLERTFDTPGWQLIEAWARKNAEQQLIRAATATTWEDHRMATGARLVYEIVASLRESTEAEFVAKAEEALLQQGMEDELFHE